MPDTTVVPCPDPHALTPADRKVLADYWRSRGEGEMGAEQFFLQLIEDLTALGSPQSIVALARRACADEARHGRWGRDWAVFFGHEDTSEPVALKTRALTFPGASERENRLLRVAFCCFTETAGCHVLQDIRPRITYPALKDLNRRHLADELVHARVGWGHLATLNESDRRMVARRIPLLLDLLPKAVVDGPESDEFEHLVPWGYLTPKVLRAAHERAVREVILPGLEHLGLLPREEQTLERGAA